MSKILTVDSLNTNPTITATGTSAALIAGQGAGLSILVRHVSYHAATTTTGRQAFSFLPSAGANAFTRSVLTSGDTGEINILGGWLLPTNAGLYLAMSSTSTPTIDVTVVADIVNRNL